ncbi:FIVAR domain-containing protein [Bifidobacterium sp. CP2]|uniref:Ig-like domain-containing protein n=1 Tax=Bifidobacterium sp. CP2 TaxID=2809025 RepID=UPI001BDC5E6C|nr:Ig-like domain-containing protein [Bifidobacterium sp. CP2]MBT1181461.1 FIVAR domain-containing protein [Bifidobacterium sp. CP2]
MVTHSSHHVARRSATILLAGVLSVGMVMPFTTSAYAADGVSRPNTSLGFPTFKGAKDPIPAVDGLATNTISPANSYLQQIFDKDKANGAGTDTKHDFWIDRMLTRTGTDPQQVSGAPGFQGPYGPENWVAQGEDANGNKYSYNNPDGNGYLFTRGRAAFMYTYKTDVIGFGGNLAYWDVTDQEGYDITATVDGQQVALTEDGAQRKQTPSYWTSVYTNADKSLTVTVVKYITNNNVLVTELQLTGTKTQDVTLTANAPLATTAEGDELTGRFAAKNNLTTVYPRFSGNGFTPQDGKLVSTVHVTAGAKDPVRTKVQLGLVTDEIPASRTEYEATRTGDRKDPAASYTAHVTEYNQWWVDNIPYMETPEHNIDKTLFYRWWLSRFNYLDADIPGGPMAFPTSIEGVLGYNNAIDLTVGMFIDDLKWMRNPEYSYGPWLNMGENARSNGQYRDNQADPQNWGASHTQWISEAAWKSYQIHGGDADIAQKFADYAYGDTKGQLAALDSDGDGLLDTNWNAWTGNDADAVSFDEVSGARLDRAESATVYAGAKAAAEAYREVGGAENEAKAKEMDEYAAKVKNGVIDNLWDSKDKLIRHQFANGAKKDQQAKYKEINNFTPYFTDLMPAEGDKDYNDDYESALRLLADADQHPVFPFATANQADDKLVRELGKKPTNNFSVINSTLYFRIYSEAIRKYHAADKGYVTPEQFKQLLYWNAFAHYQGGDNQLIDQNEFWNNASTENGGKVQYRSWIHHTQLGTTNWTMVEDVAGVRTRTDNKLELYPIAIPGWNHFIVNNLSYHGKNLTVVWNNDGHYTDAPKGYSAYVDNKLVFTSDKLAHVVYDPTTGKVDVQDKSGAKVTNTATADLPDAKGVVYKSTDRVTQVLAKAGVDAANDDKSTENLAKGADVEATYEADKNNGAAKNAVDGTTTNVKYWSTKGSPNKTDTLTVDLGKEQTVDDVRLFFYKTTTSATDAGLAEPQMYTVEYLDKDGTWKAVPDQTRTPAIPAGNLNRVQFSPVTTSKLRVTVTPQPGYAVALKEFEAYNTGEKAEAAGNTAPSVDAFIKDTRVGRVEISGTVKDDGLPNGTLSTEWSVVSAPEGGEATFENAKSVTTTAKFSKEGAYVLRLTASDGDKTSSFDLTVNATVSDGTVNVAPNGTPSASYTATSWYNIKTVNDGKIVYNQNEGYSTNAWGTLRQDNQASEWLQYDWDTPQRLTKAAVAFWYDGGGTMVPKSWKLQYQNDKGEWVDVPLKAGTGYPAKGDQMNNVEFASTIVTSKLRAVFNASGSYYGIAVSEFEAYAEDPLGVDPVEVSVKTGEQPKLPGEVSVYYGDGTRQSLPVTWDKIDASKLAQDGDFTIVGTVKGSSLPAEARIWVRSSPGVTMNATVDAEQTVYVGAKSITLPTQVIGVSNSGDNHMLPVEWNADDVKAIDLNKVGDYVVNGTATSDINANDKPAAKLTVHVIEGKGGDTPQPTPADKTKLAAKIAEVEGEKLDESKYTADSWKAYADALAAAKTVNDDANATQSQVDDALAKLTAARDGLKEGVNESKLTEAVDKASKTDHSAYASDKLDALDQALADGQRVLANANAAQADVDNAVKAIDDAIKGLGDKLADAPRNIAKDAKVVPSYVTSWNKAEAVNDGEVVFTPTGSTDTDNPKVWGTWQATNPATQSLEYDWENPVSLDKVSTYFWYDNTADDTSANVPLPKGWSVQYFDAEANDWKDVTLEDGEQYTVNKDKASTVSFKPVTTAKLRVTVNANTDGTKYAAIGVSEIAAYAAPETLVTTELDKAVTTAESLKAEDYVSGWDELQTALKAAKDVQSKVAAGDKTVDQAAVDAAAKALDDAIAALKKQPVKVAELAIQGAPEGTLKVGDTATLTAVAKPDDAADKTVTWTSGKPDVVSVDENGVITAKAAGTATITATANDGSKVSASVDVTVEEKGEPGPENPDQPGADAKLDKLDDAIAKGEAVDLGKFTPDSAKALGTALSRAKALRDAVKAGQSVGQKELNQAAAAVDDAIKALVPLPDSQQPGAQGGLNGQGNGAAGNGGKLSRTGATVGGVAAVAVIALLAGAGTVVARRRRRD